MTHEWPRSRSLSMALCVVSLLPSVAFCLVPLIVLTRRALQGRPDAGALTWTNVPLLFRSLALCFLVAAFATVLGASLGVRLGSYTWPGKAVARVVLLLPLLIPPYLHAVGWTTLLRSGGAVSEWFSDQLGVPADTTTGLIYSFVGAVFVLTLAYFPVAMLFAEKALEWSSPSLMEAAQVFGAGRLRAFWIARWPFLRPAALSAAMIVLLLTASDLGVPTILKVDVFNFEVFTQLAAFNDLQTATLLCIPLAMIGLMAVALERRLAGEALQHPDTTLEPARRAGTTRAATNMALVVLCAFVTVGLPVGAIVGEAVRGDAMTRMAELAAAPAWNTCGYGASVVVALLLLSIGATMVLQRAGAACRWVTDAILALGFAVPSTVVALGLIAAYDRPAVSAMLTPSVLVVAAIVVRYAIVGQRIIAQSVQQIPDEMLEAAALDGAGGFSRVVWMVAPLMRTALMAVALFGFILAASEIGSTILLHPPGGETLPIALYSIEANSPRSYVAALSLIQLGWCAGALLLFSVLRSVRFGH